MIEHTGKAISTWLFLRTISNLVGNVRGNLEVIHLQGASKRAFCVTSRFIQWSKSQINLLRVQSARSDLPLIPLYNNGFRICYRLNSIRIIGLVKSDTNLNSFWTSIHRAFQWKLSTYQILEVSLSCKNAKTGRKLLERLFLVHKSTVWLYANPYKFFKCHNFYIHAFFHFALQEDYKNVLFIT